VSVRHPFRDEGFDAWRSGMRSKAATGEAPRPLRFAVTCADCGHRHRLARSIQPLEVFYIVCHNCELPLRVSWSPR
jgi:hypothetical protein